MALGGGVFTTQNKKLPGAYINFVSAARASSTLADRGIAALPLAMSWGETGKVITMTSDDLLFNARKILGYNYDAAQIASIREVFKYATTVHLYRLNNAATKATCEFCDARCGGARGNDISIVITANVDTPANWDVKTLLGTEVVDEQKNVATNTDNLVDNDFVVWKSAVALKATAKTPLTTGADGTVAAADWTKALAALESESFNTLGIVSTDDSIKSLAIAFTKRMRDEVGVKFQTVVYDKAADDKGIINVTSHPTSGDTADLVAWVTGLQAGCAVNASCTNRVYNGEYDIDVSLTQTELEAAIDNGEFVFHKVGDEVRALVDINSKVTVTMEEGEDFKSNQTIRVLDQIANDIATLFNTRYLGIIPNDDAGRVSLWNDIVKHHQELLRLRAIEEFEPADVTVAQGDTKKSVVVADAVMPTNAMEQLYMNVVVS